MTFRLRIFAFETQTFPDAGASKKRTANRNADSKKNEHGRNYEKRTYLIVNVRGWRDCIAGRGRECGNHRSKRGRAADQCSDRWKSPARTNANGDVYPNEVR